MHHSRSPLLPQSSGNWISCQWKKEPNCQKNTLKGLKAVVWRGRWETKVDGNRTWYIDGAHTVDSIQLTGRWFADIVQQKLLPTRPPNDLLD